MSRMMAMACAGNVLMSSNLSAPKYCETSAEMALRVCPNTQTSMEMNAPAIPTAAKASVASKSTFPTTAVSVIDSKGSATPEIKAGIASLLTSDVVIFVFKECVRNSEKDTHFAWESKYLPVFYNREVRKTFGF